MATIVLHAGMPKTGSTSIQRWVEREAASLRARGIDPVVIRPGDRERPRVLPYRGGPVTSGPIVKRYRELQRPAPLMLALATELDRLARGSRSVLVTAEHFADLLRKPDPHFAGALERLAGDHEVLVAYYVRPQHSAVEAAWKQYGFRDPDEQPSSFVRTMSATLRHLRTYRRARRTMPSVTFAMRPFRSDLLFGGDVVTDFARRFLGIDDMPTGASQWSNPGLPLEAANYIHASYGHAFPHTHEGLARLNALKGRLQEAEVPETDAIRRSRMIIQHHCHTEHEADNRTLSRLLRWRARPFVPPVDWAGQVPGTLDELDALWHAPAGDAATAVYDAAIRDVLGTTPGRRRGRLRARVATVARRLGAPPA